MVVWTDPVLYLNGAALIVLALTLHRVPRDAVGWRWLWTILLAGTALHFLGALVSVPADSLRVFISGFMLLAIAVPALRLAAMDAPTGKNPVDRAEPPPAAEG